MWWGGGGEGKGVNGSKFGDGKRLFGTPRNPLKMSHTMLKMCCFGDFLNTDIGDRPALIN